MKVASPFINEWKRLMMRGLEAAMQKKLNPQTANSKYNCFRVTLSLATRKIMADSRAPKEMSDVRASDKNMNAPVAMLIVTSDSNRCFDGFRLYH